MIRIGTRYGIEVLPDQYAVIEFRIAEKGKSQGEEKQKTIGYYSGIASALRGIRNEMIRNYIGDHDMSLYEALNTIKAVDAQFWRMAKEECKENG